MSSYEARSIAVEASAFWRPKEAFADKSNAGLANVFSYGGNQAEMDAIA
jgi:hypothetical protein